MVHSGNGAARCPVVIANGKLCACSKQRRICVHLVIPKSSGTEVKLTAFQMTIINGWFKFCQRVGKIQSNINTRPKREPIRPLYEEKKDIFI